MIRSATALCLLLGATATHADLRVQFVEGAPTDRFRFVNAGSCGTGPVEIVVDLAGSAAGLIFDTTERGSGVQVYQPFRLVEGRGSVKTVSAVSDGDTQAVLTLSDLAPGQAVAFTIDVDDTLSASSNGQIMISGGEIAGARAEIRGSAGVFAGDAFDATGTVTLPWQNCTS